MARERRSVRRSAFTSDKLALCNDAEFLLFVGLIVNADDDGRESGKPQSLKTKLASRTWPVSKISKMMAQLNTIGLINWYSCECGSWYEIVGWEKSQRGAWQGLSKVDSTITSYSAVHCKQCGGPLKTVGGSTKSGDKRSEMNRSEMNRSEAREPEPSGNVDNPECAQVHEPEGEAERTARFLADAAERRARLTRRGAREWR